MKGQLEAYSSRGRLNDLRVRAERRLAAFREDESGSLIIFGLFCFCMMLVLAGVAIDLMRFEERRTVLQNTIDRASLAAADLQQTLDPKEVVKDYFVKAGLTPPADSDIIVTQNAIGTSRKVEVKVAEQMPTWFMKTVGIETLSTPAASTAEESIGQIEISLVLDVSGSMNSNNRLTNLKPAAKAFVDQIFDSADAGKVSISVIPYATQVTMTDYFASYFNMTNEHNFSNCIEFEDGLGDFDTTAMSFGNAPGDRLYQRNGHFDPFYRSSPLNLTNCPSDVSRGILPFSGDRDQIKAYIDNLWAGGNTSIDVGMKWGVALLDPSFEGVVDGMIADGQLPSSFSDRPYAWNDTDALKVIVLMTDGANTTEYRLRDAYDHGVSLLERNSAYSASSTSKNQYSLWDPAKGKYYIFALDKWRDEPYGNKSGDYGYSGSPRSVPMTWQEVWAKMSIYYFSDYIIYDAYGSSSLRNKWRPASVSNPIATTYIRSEKDDLTLKMCNTAKAASPRVRIYTIAFEAPSQGVSLLSACQNAGFYEVEGLDIMDAFAGIANSINKLRLTH